MTVSRTLRQLAALALVGAASTACQPALRPLVAPQPDGAESRAGANSAPRRLRAVSPDSLTSLASPAAVMRVAADVFGDSTDFDGIADGRLDEEPTWDIDVRSYETHERVEFYVRSFTSEGARENMSNRLTRGSSYEPMIRAKLRAAGMPEDLYYLALIESGYEVNALSSASAVGMWQFMGATGREVGLRVDWWLDERRDPARSTDAAISFLQQLQNQFGSLYLAAAAYNGGPGRIARGLTRYAGAIGDAQGDDRFFALAEQDYLYSETKNYVPKLIAAALVGKTPERFGMTVERASPYQYDSLRVGPGGSLAAVASALDFPLDSLVALNPAVLRGAAPPDSALWVRIPAGMALAAAGRYAQLSDEERAGWHEEAPSAGESLATVGKRVGISESELRWFNPGLRTGRGGAIADGQLVRIPAAGTLLAAREVPYPGAGISGRSGGTTTARVHTVRAGESLGVIGQRFGLSVSRLKSLNGLRSDRIQVGQRLAVGSGGGGATASRASRSRSAPTTHAVRRGESLSVIAERYGISVTRLKSLNGLRSDRIKAGQKLKVSQE